MVLHDMDAVSVHLREALAYHADTPTGATGYEKLAFELSPRLEALQTTLPSPGKQRAEASLLLSDLRDAGALMRSAKRLNARRMALERIEQDYRLYESMLEALGCSHDRASAL